MEKYLLALVVVRIDKVDLTATVPPARGSKRESPLGGEGAQWDGAQSA